MIADGGPLGVALWVAGLAVLGFAAGVLEPVCAAPSAGVKNKTKQRTDLRMNTPVLEIKETTVKFDCTTASVAIPMLLGLLRLELAAHPLHLPKDAQYIASENFLDVFLGVAAVKQRLCDLRQISR